MTEQKLEELIAVTKRGLVLLAAIDARLGRIERKIGSVDPVYKVAADGVLTHVPKDWRIADEASAVDWTSAARVIPIRRAGLPDALPYAANALGIPEGESLL